MTFTTVKEEGIHYTKELFDNDIICCFFVSFDFIKDICVYLGRGQFLFKKEIFILFYFFKVLI